MNSWLLSLALSLVMLASAGCTQNSQPSQFDELTTTSQVQQFVRNIDFAYGDFKGFIVTDTLGSWCAGRQTCVALTSLPSWSKADFDGNGRVDLLVAGYHEKIQLGSREVVCFLNGADGSLKPIRLDDGYDCAVPQLQYLRGKAAIRYAHLKIDGDWKKHQVIYQVDIIYQVDTLIFNRGGFIEYNHAPRDYRIEKIAISTSVCFGTCPVFDLQIARSGAASYHAEEYNEKKGNFTAIVESESLSRIWALVNYLDFPSLKNNYITNASDGPACTLTITYGGGKVKTIQDYDEHGTFGLSQLYQLLFALRTTQAWK